LSRFYAVKGWIGRGVGPALMRACIAASRQRGAAGIWLGVWGKNERAIRFYRKWGFVQRGAQSFVLGSDHQTDLVMWLPLAESAATSRNDRQPDRMA
jgi:ribosomal protein S18 acetylase RimI-like enzyme